MKAAERYAFGSYVLEIDERRLTEDGRPVSLPPKAYDVLVALVRRPGQLGTKRELLDSVWPDAFVEDPREAVAQAQQLRARGVRSLCVHGDNPQALAFVRELRAALERKGIAIRVFP